MRRRRGEAGSVEVFAVLLLLAAVGAAMTFYYTEREDVRRVAVARQTGALFASWFLAAHRASQTEAAAYRVALGGGPFSLTPGQLRVLGATAVGLRDVVDREAVLSVGIISDGTPRGVPMAFGILEPVDADGVALRAGALDAGLAFVAEGAGAGTPVAAHVGAIEVAIGRPVATDALVVTADVGVRYRERVLYRRAQPGRAYLNRMETALDAGANDLLRGGEFGGAVANVSGDVTVAGVAPDVVAVDVLGRVSAFRILALADVSNDRDVEAVDLVVLAQLDVGLAASGAVTAGTVLARGAGHIEGAGGLQSAGSIDADRVAVRGDVVVTGTVNGGAVFARVVEAAGTVRATGVVTASSMGGPSGRVSGAMTVGSCSGCVVTP